MIPAPSQNLPVSGEQEGRVTGVDGRFSAGREVRLPGQSADQRYSPIAYPLLQRQHTKSRIRFDTHPSNKTTHSQLRDLKDRSHQLICDDFY